MLVKTTRRNVIKNLLVGSAALMANPAFSCSYATSSKNQKNNLNNNIKQSVCRWTYDFLSLDELCNTVKQIGFSAIDLVGPKDWETLKKHDVYSSMCNGA